MQNILIVDDEENIRNILKEFLELAGFEVMCAENGFDALNKATENEYDLVITDLVMPDRNGLELILDIKKLSPRPKIIAMSGGGGIRGRYDYLEISEIVGAEKILRKPFSMEQVQGMVRDMLPV
jgi:DNA-binding response OmpR family regulator